MKKQGWKWLAAFFLFAVLSVLPVENIWAYDVETEYWEPFGDATMTFEWEKNCDYEVLKPAHIGGMHSVYFELFSTCYEEYITIKVRSSNPNVIAIYPSYEEHIAYHGSGNGRVIYTIEGYGVASIIFDIGGQTVEKEITVVPDSVDVEKIEKVDYNSVKLTWEKVPGVSGVVIERAPITDAVKPKDEEYVTYLTFTNDVNSAIIDVDWDKLYSYRVVPYIHKGTKKLYAENYGKSVEYCLEGIATEIKSVKKSGSSSLQISWNKVNEAIGYKVYRSEYESEGYKCVYTATSNNVTSWKQKVTKGQRYFYRVITLFSDRQSVSQSVAQMIPKYTKAKVQKLSGTKEIETESRDHHGVRGADEEYYYVADGKLHLIVVDKGAYEGLIDYTLNSKGKVTSKKKVRFDFFRFGSVYRASDGKFYVVGSQHYQSAGKNPVVLKITQYSSKWKKLKTASIRASDFEFIYLPPSFGGADVGFEASFTNCSMTMRDGELYIHVGIFRDPSNDYDVGFRINCADMSFIKADFMQASNATQQESVFKDNDLYLLTHGNEVAVSGMENYPDTNALDWDTNALPIEGVAEKNLKGCGIGGMAVGNKNVLVSGISVRNAKSISSGGKDVFLSVIDRKTGKTTLKWLTSYNKKKATTEISDTRMIKLSEDRYAIMYSTADKKGNETLYYMVVNNAGKKIYTASYTGMHFTAASQPILYNGSLVWMEGEMDRKNGKRYNKTTLYSIPAIDDEDYIVGKTFTYKNNKYKITSASTVDYIGTKNKKATKIEIPETVSYGNQSFKVTRIADKALQKNKKVKMVLIGANIKEIGKSAFSGCKKLSTLEIKTKSLNKIGKSAFKGISSKATIKVPKAKLTSYKKLFKGKGQSSKVKWKKI